MKTNVDVSSWFSSVQVSLPPSAVALVLAGGKGSRLKAAADPELRGTPKVLVPIKRPGGTTTMLGHALNELAGTGFRRVSLLTSSDPEAGGPAVEAYAQAQFGSTFELHIYREGYPLGTAGAAFAALRHLESEVAVIIPADTLFPFSLLPSAVASHHADGSAVTWVVTTSPGLHAQNTGRILLDATAPRIRHALEGVDAVPPADVRHRLRGATSAGVVIVRPGEFCELFEQYARRLAEPCATDLYREFIPWMVSRAVPVGAFDIGQAAPDLGTPDRLRAFGR
ncbi:NTP transferase domain-containing protein [Streptomyces sp. DT24]|uniref:NTP transferase domain-containing protein n=1 Tax=unclassified Streptomyces TaxID=2593676 RepID=UPI0023B91633|nr:NTP transferase domain-containing protein [Streptomyces sp. AM 4-1-1]WEH32568.1 NTP transferase domain-containing protein [Streptomyces sp. AM 4-1-1]